MQPSTHLLLLTMLIAGFCGCQNGESQQRPVAVVVSGDTAGWIVPCGCASNQSGGLPRRGSYVAGLREKTEVVLVDTGGAPGGLSAYDRLKFEAVLRGEVAMGIAAHNLGAAEIALGAEELRRLADELQVPWVSANVCDRQGEAIVARRVISEAGGRRIAVIGVVGPQYATESLQVTPPRQAILDVLAEPVENCDAVVVLAYLPEDELRALAESLPEADLVVGGPTGQPIQPKQIGPTLLASATNQGKFLARFDAPMADNPGRWQGRIDELDETYPDHAEQLANLERFYEELRHRDFAPAETSFVEPLPANLPPGFAVAGTSRCDECHEDESRQWIASRHADAWHSLQEKGAEVDPECQRCHTTGYGLPGGFASVGGSTTRTNVGCESCHGPSQAHVDDSDVRTAHFGQAINRCIACHDHENSPDFELDEYWAMIRHGESDQPTTGSQATEETDDEVLP